MSPSAASDNAIRCFDLAWLQATMEYSQQRVNSEACLQALLYWGLRNELEKSAEGYRVFVNCWVVLENNKRVYFDTLVCFEKKVVLALELKYKPNSKPKAAEVKNDLKKLAAFRRTTTGEETLQVHLRRFRHSDKEQKLRMTLTPTRRLVFAAFVKESGFAKTSKDFWLQYGLDCGSSDWEKRRSLPPRLCIRLAEAKSDGTATVCQFGGIKHMSVAPAPSEA